MCCLTVFILSKVKSLTTHKPLIACFNLPRRRNLEMRVLYADSHRFQRLQMKGALDGNEQGKQSLRICRSCSAHISQVAMNMRTCDSEACSPLNSWGEFEYLCYFLSNGWIRFYWTLISEEYQEACSRWRSVVSSRKQSIKCPSSIASLFFFSFLKINSKVSCFTIQGWEG